MKKPMVLLALCFCLVWMAGCTAAPTLPTATITATPITPTPTITDTPMPPLPTEVQAMATAATSGPTPEWTFAAGGPIRSPITVTDGVVYFGSEDHNLYAVNIATHDLKWKFETDGAIRSQPAVSKDMVYIASDDSYLYAVSKSDGSLSWKSQVEKEVVKRTQLVAAGAEWDWYTSAPILQDTTLYIGGTDGNLYALDAATGKTLWKYAAIDMSAIRTTPLVAAGVVYFGDTAGNFYAIDAQKGIKLWNYATTYSNHDNGLALVDNVVYFGTDMGFFALEAKTGIVK